MLSFLVVVSLLPRLFFVVLAVKVMAGTDFLGAIVAFGRCGLGGLVLLASVFMSHSWVIA